MLDFAGIAAIITALAGFAGAIGFKIRDERRARRRKASEPESKPAESKPNDIAMLWTAHDELNARLADAEGHLAMLVLESKERKQRGRRSRPDE